MIRNGDAIGRILCNHPSCFMIQDLRRIIYDTVIEAKKKLTPGGVERAVAWAASVDRQTVKATIKDLIEGGELTYTYLYGTSFLELSFDRPVKLSKRIVIKPPAKVYLPQPGEVVIDVAAGAAFGNGAHPSTCLALRALDDVLSDHGGLNKDNLLTGLDVGTGTGILAIAMAKLGVHKALGIDIDACAVSEATHNVSLNGLAEQVTITNAPLYKAATHFSVTVANLAYPTLRAMSAILATKVEMDGVLILSGFKKPACKALGEAYGKHGLELGREEIERGWACLTFRKRSPGCS